MTPHELAIGFLRRGYVVIPVAMDKRPLVSWKQYQIEIPTETQLNLWWQMYPEAQVGIITGAISDLTVIDVEAEGDATRFLELDTYTVKTGGGGYHFYFDYEKEVHNAVRTLPFTDVRSEGGYVVAAGSKSTKGSYEVVKDSKPMKMPEDILELFRQKTVAFNPAAFPTTEKKDWDNVPEYGGAGEGSRNDSMTKYTGKVLTTMPPMYWDKLAWPMLIEANRKNTPPLPEAELRLIYKSISERELPKIGERRYNDRRSLPTSYNSKGATPVEALGPIITLEEAARTQKIDVDNTTPTNISIFDEALMGGFSPGDLVIIAGRSGVGKTTFAQDLTASYLSAKHPALWFSYEVMAVPLFRKFQEMEIDEEMFTKLYVPSPPMTSSLDDISTLIKKAKEEQGIKMVAIDHIGFIDPDMNTHGNHALAVTHIVRGLKRLAVEQEIVVILPVHVRKVDAAEPTLEDVRDSYGVVQEADVVFLIDRKRGSSAAEREESYYSNFVRIMLAKNRKTGISKSGTFSLLNGRYAYQESLSKADEEAQDAPRGYRKAKTEVDKQWDKIKAELPD